MEELRFAKRQQSYVAAATLALIAGAFQMAQGMRPLAYLDKTRKILDPKDDRSW